MADLTAGLRTRNQDELAAVHFTPATGIAVSKLDKIDRAVEFVLPIPCLHLVLMGINLDERSGTDQRIQRVILDPYVPKQTVPQIQLLQKCNRDFTPSFKHAGDQVRPCEFDVLAEFEWQHDRLSWWLEIRPNQVRVRQADQSLFLGDIQEVNPEKSHDLNVVALVNEAQAVKLINARGKFSILDIGKPAVGNVIVLVVLLLRNLLAQFLYSSR